MSYIDLKHLLADLALEAIRHPEDASWAPILAAYGALAEIDRPSVPWRSIHAEAARLGEAFGWTPTADDLERLIKAGLLEKERDAICIRRSFAPHLGYLKRQTARLLGALQLLQGMAASPSLPDPVRRGVALFNAALFFECHELLEDAWRATDGPAKNLYHGIVQVAAAFYHYEKGNLHGARTLLTKGVQRLEPYPPEYLGVKLTAFRDALQPWAKHFEADMKRTWQPQSYPLLEPVTW